MRRVDHPRFQDAVREVEQSIDQAWRKLRAEYGTTEPEPEPGAGPEPEPGAGAGPEGEPGAGPEGEPGAGPGACVETTDEHDLAELVLQDPAEFDWRVVDGALDRLACDECGKHLGAGPLGCAKCDLANGFRFAAREVDRPHVPPGNEHAIRVASAVARTRHRYSPRARCGYEIALPDLLAGVLPTTAEAQRYKALINQLTDDELEELITVADLQRKDWV